MTPWTVDCQAPLSLEFSRQESWSRLPFPPPGIRSTWDHLGQAGLEAEEYQVYVGVTEMAFWKEAKPFILQTAGTEASKRDY